MLTTICENTARILRPTFLGTQVMSVSTGHALTGTRLKDTSPLPISSARITRMFGCPDCANADEEPKTQPMITKGKMNFLTTLMLVEQKQDCASDAAESQFWNCPDTLEKSRRWSGIRRTKVACC